MKQKWFWLLPTLLLILVLPALAGAESAPLAYRVNRGASGDYAVITGGTAGESLLIPAQIDGLPVREVDRAAFAGNTFLRSVTVEEGVRSLGMEVFLGCAALEEVALPESLTFIDKDAFRDCAALRKITMPGIATAGQVREGAFAGVALTELKLSDGTDLFDPLLQEETLRAVTRMDGWLYRPVEGGSLMITGMDHVPDRLVIPDEIGGKPVTAIGEEAFRGNKNLVSLALPDGLKVIGNKAFADCASLSEVSLPAGLARVEPLAFFRTALSSPALPIGAVNDSSRIWYASADRTDPMGWTWNLLADGTAMISGYAAQSTSLLIPEEIDGHEVTAVMQAEDRYLSGAGKIETVQLPAGLKVIGERAFYRFGMMKELQLPRTLEEIGNGAFYNCARVDHLKIPGTLKRLGREAFNYCRRLGEIWLPDGLTEIAPRTFEGCSRLATVRLPATLKIIGERAFAQTDLSWVLLPEGLEIIRKGAFLEHRITDLIFPASVKHLSSESFYSYRPGCPRKVRFLNPDTELEIGVFGYAQRDPEQSLYDPLNWIDLYHEPSDSDWKTVLHLTCYQGSTADQLYIHRVRKDYLRKK